MLDKQRLRTFVLGGAVGALVGILLAPRSGKELRGSLANRAGEARERSRETYFGAQEQMRDRLAEAREGSRKPRPDVANLGGPSPLGGRTRYAQAPPQGRVQRRGRWRRGERRRGEVGGAPQEGKGDQGTAAGGVRAASRAGSDEAHLLRVRRSARSRPKKRSGSPISRPSSPTGPTTGTPPKSGSTSSTTAGGPAGFAVGVAARFRGSWSTPRRSIWRARPVTRSAGRR